MSYKTVCGVFLMILLDSGVYSESTSADGSSKSTTDTEIPKDNSNYEEGKSRYIWLPADDANGTMYLVDLQADEPEKLAKPGSDIKYWLYTRANKDDPVIIKGNTTRVTQFNGKNPLFVLAHGWRGNAHTELNTRLVPALLKASDCTVISVDWSADAGHLIYQQSAKAVAYVGTNVGRWLDWLVSSHGGDWGKVHLIGFSLGGHVVGYAGRAVYGKIARITGLDPAGPHWTSNPETLHSSDAKYVEAIHTNAGYYGIQRPLGHVDFYPNGGSWQPGCPSITVSCNHQFACKLMEATVLSNSVKGSKCWNVKEALAVKCSGAEQLLMGNIDFNKKGSGVYGLKIELSDIQSEKLQDNNMIISLQTEKYKNIH